MFTEIRKLNLENEVLVNIKILYILICRFLKMCDKSGPKFFLDFQKLVKTFCEICPDFISEPDYKHATVSRRFAEQVIFEYSKQCKEAKDQGIDKTWRIKLDCKSDDGKPLNHQVIVSTCIKREHPQHQPFLLHGYLQLTFKQASLLAVSKYCQIIPHQVRRHEIVLTPLAGVVFAKDDMPDLANALGEPLPELIMAVISSCQTLGYYLVHSRCYIAVVALLKTVADPKLRGSLVQSTIKNYAKHGKEFDKGKFQICCEFLKSKNKSTPPPPENLISEIMAIDLIKPSCSAPRRIMKCAANFNGNLEKNDKK